MKTNLTLLLLIIVMVSCQLKKSDNTETAVARLQKLTIQKIARQIRSKLLLFSGLIKQKPNIAKSTAFVLSKQSLIREDGKVNLLSFAKNNPRL